MSSDDDLRQLWRMLMGELGFSETSLWWVLLDRDGRALPVLPQLTDLPTLPTARDLDGLAGVLSHLLAEDAGPGEPWEVAFLRSRPGRGGLTATDRAWARGLLETTARHGLRCRPVHVATDDCLVVVPPGDLLADAG